MTSGSGGGTSNKIGGGIFGGPVLQAGQIFNPTFVTSQAAAAPVALDQLPPLASGFTGREVELAQVAGLLDPAGDAGAVVVSAVAGLAGVGKTALAVHAAHAAREAGWFAGGVLFIDLHGYDQAPVQPGQALDALLRALGIPGEHIPDGTEQRAGLYRSVLAQITEPVLIVADNASAEPQVRLLLPGPGPHRVIVTSRHTLAGLGARLLDVTVLDQAASIELLDRVLRAARPEDDRISGDPAAAQRLGEACGGLPLALQITAALLAVDPALAARELAEALANEVGRLEALRYDDGSGIGAPSVAAAFELSYWQLDADAARLFRLLSANPGPDVSTAAAAALAGWPSDQARTVLGRLARAHLVEIGSDAGRWRMHDLLRLYAWQLPSADSGERDQATDRLFDYYLTHAEAAQDHLIALAGDPVPGEFTGRRDALTWLDAERPNLIAAVALAAATGRDEIAMYLPLALGEYLSWRRRFDDWLTVLVTSRDCARRQQNRVEEAGALNNLGLALVEVRRFEEAISALQEAAAIYRETGHRHREGAALDNLGLALVEVRRFEEAISAHQKALAICRETGDRHGEGTALGNLGGALVEVRRFEEAISAQRDAAAICRETGDRHGEGMALGNLGRALRDVRRFEEAISADQEAAAIFRETGDRHREGKALDNLGLALEDLRRFEEAISAHQKALAIYRETGDRHGAGMVLSGLGSALEELRRFEEAISAHQKALAIYRETGDRHGEGMALNNLGLALRNVRRFEEAISAHQDAAAIYRETGDRDGEGAARNNLGLALQEVRRFEEAISAHQEAAAIRRETGDRHREGLALNNLGLALQKVRRFEEAISAHQDAAAIYRETGDRHREGTALNNLGGALRRVRRFEEAISAHQDAAAIFRETGDRHGEGMALGNLGMALQDMRRFEEAISAHQDAAAIFREAGDRHREGTALSNLESARAAQAADSGGQ